MNKITLLKYGGVFVIGAFIGAGAAAGEPPPEPEVVERVEEVEVEVPVAPPACLRAIELARENLGRAGEFAGVVADYPMIVSEAADAGILGDVQGLQTIADEVAAKERRIAELNDALAATIEEFRSTVTECEEAG